MSGQAKTMPLLGYCDRPSVAPGETIGFHVSCLESDGFDADLVRLRHGDLAPGGPGVKVELIPDASFSGHHQGEEQRTPAGSFAVLEAHEWLKGLEWSVRIRVCPWMVGIGRQTLLHCVDRDGSGLVLAIEDHCFRAEALSPPTFAPVSSLVPIEARCWYELEVTATARELRLEVTPTGAAAASRLRFRHSHGHERHAVALAAPLKIGDSEMWLAAAPADREPPFAADHFNGKLEGPRFSGGEADGSQALSVDFAAELHDPELHAECSARGPSSTFRGTLYNLPMRAVTSSEWTGEEIDFRAAPGQYGAIHFHSDDLFDACWPQSFSLKVPDDLPSGVYAARLRGPSSVDHVPFAVRPAAGGKKAPIAFLLPTATYLAYANDKFGTDGVLLQLIAGRVAVMQPESMHLHMHRDLGSSLYDTHIDGSGVCFSSWRRPLLNMRPAYSSPVPRVLHFNADLHLVDWLMEKEFEFDTVTDHDLHDQGAALLRGYRTIVTATHPEYWSASMLDSLEAYLEEGGRLMYLGGNGFYWVTAFDPKGSGAVEVRRVAGTETWTSEPGQARLQFSSEPGGIWRHRGRAPQRIAGVGFVAQGHDISGFYRRLDPVLRGDADSWVFDGVEGDIVGDSGLVGGGAAGVEIDAVDQLLGTPPQTEILASSEGHTDVMLEVRENVGMTFPNMGGTQNPAVRANLALFELEGGGAVFSTGSIAWCGSLSADHYENAVSKVTENVLRRFSD